MPGPWRQVVHIDNQYRQGRVGYESLVWCLTLECSHIAIRHGGRFIPERDMFKPIRRAPEKVRCVMCHALKDKDAGDGFEK